MHRIYTHVHQKSLYT